MASAAGTSCASGPTQQHRGSSHPPSQSCSTAGAHSQPPSALGYFRALPLEIFQMLLGYLSVKDISVLSMVSKAISNRLINCISTPSGNRRLLLQDFHNITLPGKRDGSCIIQHYKSLGLLLKRCTLLLPTKDRLTYIHKVLSKVSCFKLDGCPSPLRCVGLQCYGVFLQILIAGWDELECHRVFNFLCELSSLPRKVRAVVSRKPGSARSLELRIRLFCRSVLLNPWVHRRDSAFWLTRVLKPWPAVNQARLLYIMFGPVSSLDGHVAWQKMIEGPADEASLKGLADAIKLLTDAEAREWTADDVISLLDELSVVPREWLLENNARLLILSGSNVCFTFMASKAVSGRAVEVARLVVFLALVCEKDLYCMDWAVKMMQEVSKVFSTPEERNIFLESVENAFAHTVMDMLQAVRAGNREQEDAGFLNLFRLVSAQASFHKEILHLAMRSGSNSI